MGTTPASVYTQRAQSEQDQRWGDQTKFALAPLSQALQADQTRLALYANPDDPTKPVEGKEKEYQDTLDRMTQTIGQMRGVLGQKQPNPNPMEAAAGDALAKLHITNHLKNHVAQVRAQDAAKYQDQNKATAGQYAQGTPVNPYAKTEADMRGGGFSDTDITEAKRRQAGLIQKGNYKNIRGPNGEMATIDVNSEQIPAGWVLAGTSTASGGLKPIKSGALTVGVTANGKPYFAKDANNPDTPEEVKSFFAALDEGQKAQLAQKERDRQEQYAEMEKRQRISMQQAMQRTIYQFQNAMAGKQAGIADGLIGKQQQQYYAAQDLQQKMQTIMPEALAGNQQAMVALLADHIAMTTHQPGAAMRPTKALFDEAASSQPWMQGVEKHFDSDGVLTGVVLSPEQIQNMVELAPIVTAAEKSTLDQMQQSMGTTANPVPAQLQGPKTRALRQTASGAPIVQHSKTTGQYRYSTDGGRTWNAGKPPQ